MKNLKPVDIARILKINRSSVSLWIKGKTNARQDKIFAIAEKLNVSPSWLLGADVPFQTFQESMNNVSSDQLKDRLNEKFDQLTEDNKRLVLGYIDGIISSQKSKN
ncbi:helix-turn-helix domain-containing protein [Apilactobacillus sp. TMW 2.2457]|nr:helix-turn-helix domain-containing protein [Apilactobacillus xinyiensis]